MASSHDRGFVAASPETLLPMLASPAGYASWWPGAGARDPRLGLPEERAEPARVIRTELDAVEVQLGRAGSLIWVVELFQGGTIVHAILEPTLEPTRAGSRRLLRARARLREALVALWRSPR